ncbi:MAG: hypothetical protein JST80_06290 [Bdellovibrionales bacterium]|nr:hypothetical protein [Bdellovibrionales bacterium]
MSSVMIGWFVTVSVFMLNLWALMKVMSSPVLTKSQKFFQTMLVFFVPLLGAIMVLITAKVKEAAGQSST